MCNRWSEVQREVYDLLAAVIGCVLVFVCERERAERKEIHGENRNCAVTITHHIFISLGIVIFETRG